MNPHLIGALVVLGYVGVLGLMGAYLQRMKRKGRL